jgi:hypothetical protein
MIGEFNPRIPDLSTAWQLWYIDSFDRDTLPSLQASGINIVHGLYQLWLYMLNEGILENGSASFSYFYLTWGNTPVTRVDIFVTPFNNLTLLKLRRWAGLMHPGPDSENRQNTGDSKDKREALLLRLAQLHFELLQKSSRWQAAAIDWGVEAREILAKVELIADPEDL